VLCLSLALSACGAGRGAQTYKQRTTADSTNAQVSMVDIRGLQVQAPTSGDVLVKGGDALVTGRFVNNAAAADSLVSATSPVAASVTLEATVSPYGFGGTAGAEGRRIDAEGAGTGGGGGRQGHP